MCLKLRYKEAFERAKGHYHTVKDALDIIYHRRVTDDISEVSYYNEMERKCFRLDDYDSCYLIG